MEYFRLQLGCLSVLIYVGVVYFQGCSKYHVRSWRSLFPKLLILGLATVIFDGDTAWAAGNADKVSPVMSYILHAMSFIFLDATIFCLALYMLHRQLLVIGINQKIAIQWDFPITYEMARAYQKANGKYLRQNQWEDITLVMSLELGK